MNRRGSRPISEWAEHMRRDGWNARDQRHTLERQRVLQSAIHTTPMKSLFPLGGHMGSSCLWCSHSFCGCTAVGQPPMPNLEGRRLVVELAQPRDFLLIGPDHTAPCSRSEGAPGEPPPPPAVQRHHRHVQRSRLRTMRHIWTAPICKVGLENDRRRLSCGHICGLLGKSTDLPALRESARAHLNKTGTSAGRVS